MQDRKIVNIKFVALFFIIFSTLFSVGLFLFSMGENQIVGMVVDKPVIEDAVVPFKVDQILIKTLIKEDETMVRSINIMDISEHDLFIEIEPQYLPDIVSLCENNFALKPGQTKTVCVNFTSYIKEKNIKHRPDVYVGSILVKSSPEMIKGVPVVVEIETKEVLFDANIDIPVWQKDIEQGSHLEIRVRLFNLKKIGLTNLNMDYFIKDIAGNTIINENENVVVETQTSFVKVMEIPENLNPGEYVFAVVVRYGSSVGTSSLLFDVVSPESRETIELLSYYQNNKWLFWILGIILAIVISSVGSYVALCVGRFIHDGIDGIFKEKLQKTKKEVEEKKLAKKEVKPEKKEKSLLKPNLKEASKNFKKINRGRKIIILIVVLIAFLTSAISILINLNMLSNEKFNLDNVITKGNFVWNILLKWITEYYMYAIIAILIVIGIIFGILIYNQIKIKQLPKRIPKRMFMERLKEVHRRYEKRRELEEKRIKQREKLRSKLMALEQGYKSGYISEKAYNKSKKDIEKVLKGPKKR